MKSSYLFSLQHWQEEPPFKLKTELKSELDISGIHYRSDRIKPGDIFVAIPGLKTDGHLYAKDAEKRGAVLIVAEREIEGIKIPLLLVDNSKKALSALSALFFAFPSRDLILIGVSGTNGKSTTSYLIERILREAGHKTGLIGTIDWHYPGFTRASTMTSPESRDLQFMLHTMKEAGVSHVVMEVSSHAISLGRIDHTYFDLGVFTNLSQDHLDFHRDMEDYWQTKKSFFEGVLKGAHSKKNSGLILNIDDASGEKLLNSCLRKYGDRGILSVAQKHPDPLIQSGAPRFFNSGTRFNLQLPSHSFPINSLLSGSFNLDNMLCAAGAAFALGVKGEDIKNALEKPIKIPGRLEQVYDPKNKRFVFIDYAHTPDALKKVLETLKSIKKNRLILLFGCGGDRDKSKRPLMGKIAEELADICIISSDNPRSEKAEDIIKEILQGMDLKDKCLVEPDRKKAILKAISIAKEDDTLLIAGKGHEKHQIIGKESLPFNDREVAEEGLRLYG